MKKIYTLIAITAIAAGASAQVSDESTKPFVQKTLPFHHITNVNRTISNPDTTGLVNYTDFLPQFCPSGTPTYYGYTTGGELYGRNHDAINICAQGYLNVGPTPVRVEGVLMWFGSKYSDAGSSVTSKVVVKAWAMAANKAYNTNGSGTFNQTTLNAPGPATGVNAPVASADILYTDIDTTAYNYVSFPTASQPTFTADFAVGVDFSTLAAGDTAGLVSDSKNDAANLDYAFSNLSGKWFVSDQMFSNPASPDLGTGGLDNDIAVWAVLTQATGINEYYDGMKLTTYPNPAVDNAVIEYTLEKNSTNVSLIVFDPSGRKIVNNVYNQQSAGTYKVNVETTNLASGNYFYQLNANGQRFTKKFVVTE